MATRGARDAPVDYSCVGSCPMHILQKILRKILLFVVVFLGITVVSFTVIHLAPGSPTDLETTMNPLADAEFQKQLTKLYGLDKPLYQQYWDWLLRLLRFDFGISMSSDARPVITKIAERMPLTLWLNSISLFLSLVIAIPIGVLAARKRGKLFDSLTTIFVFIGFAMPSFWLALLLVLHLSIDLQLFPLSGVTSLDYSYLSRWEQVLDIAHHLALPVLVIVFGSIAGISRFMRASVLEVLRQDYILAARAKGLSESRILFGHAMRNALLPLITLLGLSLPGLIGGSVIIESVFSLPGMGQLFYGAVMARDYPLIMGNLVIGAVLTLAGNILADICYGFADPRIRSGASGK